MHISKGRESMNKYYVDTIVDGKTKYYIIRCRNDMQMVTGASRYLVYKTKTGCSPNSVKRFAFSISYYLCFLDFNKLTVGDVFEMKYDKQHLHFISFLNWVKQGRHINPILKGTPNNSTCNAYLRDVFGWFQYLEKVCDEFGDLKVFSSHIVSFANSKGVRFQMNRRYFRGFLKEEESYGRTIDKESIQILLDNCTNIRDQLLLLLLAETGFRIGELLGIRFPDDLDCNNRTLRVFFRDDNSNGARAKNAEYRRAKISQDTFDILLVYISTYRNLIIESCTLFILIEGTMKGRPLTKDAVYAMLIRLEKKTGIKATPHMLRHYFANARRKNGWDLPLIAQALGHKNIETTERYLNIEEDELFDAMDKYNKSVKGLYSLEGLI